MSGQALAWAALLLAGACEIGWAVGMKLSDGFTRLWPSIGTGAAIIASMLLMAYAFRHIPVGTGYAVWTGIGAAGTALVGMWLFQEPRDLLRLASIGMIIAGVIGLKLVSSA